MASAIKCVVVCGEKYIPWSSFRTGTEILGQAQRGWKFLRTRLVDREPQVAMRNVLRLNRHSGEFLDLLWDFDGAQCQENSDKFYALFGMIRGDAPADVEVASSVESEN